MSSVNDLPGPGISIINNLVIRPRLILWIKRSAHYEVKSNPQLYEDSDLGQPLKGAQLVAKKGQGLPKVHFRFHYSRPTKERARRDLLASMREIIPPTRERKTPRREPSSEKTVPKAWLYFDVRPKSRRELIGG